MSGHEHPNPSGVECWLSALGFAAMYWVVDSVTDFLLEPVTSLPTAILAPGGGEFVERGTAIALLLALVAWNSRRRKLSLTQELSGPVAPLDAEPDERHRQIFENSPDAAMLLDELGFLDCNQATLELFGIEYRETFVSTHPGDLSPPYQPNGQDSMSAAFQRIEQAMQHGTHRFEWIHRRPSGEDFEAEVTLTAYRVENKTQLHAIVRDISRQRRLLRRLSESEERLRVILDTMSDGLMLVGLSDGRIHEANRTFCEMSGYCLEELRGKSFLELHPIPARASMQREFERHVRGEEVLLPAAPILHRDGSIFHVDITTRPMVLDGEQYLTGILRRREAVPTSESSAECDLAGAPR